MVTPTDVARKRYSQSFTSQIFNPPEAPKHHNFPAGKRRDQTTSELFGLDNDDKELRTMPSTFHPRLDARSARMKKIDFLGSDVLPHTDYHDCAQPGKLESLEEDNDVKINHMADPIARRQQELHSDLFGRHTPAADKDIRSHYAEKKLTPNDFKWFNAPEKGQRGEGVRHFDSSQDHVTHQDRSYHEKSSQLFNRPTHPKEEFNEATEEQMARKEEAQGDMKRRANCYYSDLFGRQTPMNDIPGSHPRHPKHMCPEAEQITINQDWTDSRTELMRRHQDHHYAQKVTAADRRHEELDKRHFLLEDPNLLEGPEPPFPTKVEPLITDNSHRLKVTLGHDTQTIHQAHLQSTLMGERFYQDAENTRAWEVAELHLIGLPVDADELFLKQFCHKFDVQVVRIMMDMDPVSNLCKGRAKLVLRYNPMHDTISQLIRTLEESKRLQVRI